MIILALDTSTDVGTVAIVRDGIPLAEANHRAPMNLLTWLSPAIQQILKETNVRIQDLNAIAVGIGPGSFTGVRLQLATAKTLAQVRQIPLYGVSSLEVLAFQSLPHEGTILACMKSRQNELTAGIFQAKGTELTQAQDSLSGAPDLLRKEAEKYAGPWILAGEIKPEQLAVLNQNGIFRMMDAHRSAIHASTLAILAEQKRHAQTGKPLSVSPLFVR